MSILMIRAKEGASLILKVCGKGKIIITSSARYAHVMKVFSQCSFVHHLCSFYCLDPSYKLITWIIVSLQVEEFIHGFRRQRRGRQGCDLCERHWRHHIFLPRRQRLPSRGQVRNCIVLDMYWTTRIQGGAGGLKHGFGWHGFQCSTILPNGARDLQISICLAQLGRQWNYKNKVNWTLFQTTSPIL